MSSSRHPPTTTTNPNNISDNHDHHTEDRLLPEEEEEEEESETTLEVTVSTAAAAAVSAVVAAAKKSPSPSQAQAMPQQPQQTLTPTERAIIDMMKKHNLRASQQQQQQQQQQQSSVTNASESSSSSLMISDRIPSTATTTTTHHAFWDTQPMPHNHNTTSASERPEGPIIPADAAFIESIRRDPYTMPAGFEWSCVNVQNDDERMELYALLAHNYVEDDDALFRFEYSPEFLMWALTPPHYNPDFLFGVRTTSTTATTSSSSSTSQSSSSSQKAKKLVAFISAVPAVVQVHDHTLSVVEINFLCVHKKLRSKRLAPVLIKEVTRRVQLTGIYQAVYTAGTVLPVPIASSRYHHRSLQPKKLVHVGFSRISSNNGNTLARMIKRYKLPETVSLPTLRPMTLEDVPSVHALLTSYLSKFPLHCVFSQDEIAHWLLPRDNVINTYVVSSSSSSSNDITDLISFYHLPSSILKSQQQQQQQQSSSSSQQAQQNSHHHNHHNSNNIDNNDPSSSSQPPPLPKKDDHSMLFAVYSYYNVATSMPLVELMREALILAKQLGGDVFNALNLMDNDEFLEPLKFGLGDGHLQYYIYNWAWAGCGGTNNNNNSSSKKTHLKPNQVGIVLL